MKKKAQGLPMETIVIAALVIIVLVVLAIIMGVRFNWFSSSSQNCQAKGGQCYSADTTTTGVKTDCIGSSLETCSCGDKGAYFPGTNCEKDTRICCMNIFNPTT
jgi:hypothetical protein